MFVLDKDKDRINKIDKSRFSDLKLREREHLQEWIVNMPKVFGEDDELLFIQKEFDGFSDTRERLDLLAIDKRGDLVIIENKLDCSGKDVTWQALKYASYCSTLTKADVLKIYQSYLDDNRVPESAESNITAFLSGEDIDNIQLNKSQRIILVSGSYRKEVTSTVLWLLQKYNLRIQCFKATPFVFNEQILLSLEQIIPVKEVEEYMIKMAEKTQEEQSISEIQLIRLNLRNEFWGLLLSEINTQTSLFANINPSKDTWITASSGVSDVSFVFAIGINYVRTEVYISKTDAKVNKDIFDELYSQKNIIERETNNLTWERLDEKKACRIKQERNDLRVYEREDWNSIIDFLVSSMIKMESSFKKPLQAINIKLKS